MIHTRSTHTLYSIIMLNTPTPTPHTKTDTHRGSMYNMGKTKYTIIKSKLTFSQHECIKAKSYPHSTYYITTTYIYTCRKMENIRMHTTLDTWHSGKSVCFRSGNCVTPVSFFLFLFVELYTPQICLCLISVMLFLFSS